MHAEDTCLGFTDKDIKSIENNLNRNFNSLCDWFIKVLLKFIKLKVNDIIVLQIANFTLECINMNIISNIKSMVFT